MNVSFTHEWEQWIADKIGTGMYQTADEVISEGLRLLKERDQRLDALQRDVRAGLEAIERGEHSDYDASSIRELAERVTARGRERYRASC